MILIGLDPNPALLLAAALGAYAWRLRRGSEAGPLYPRLLRGAWLGFGLPSLGLLALAGQLPALWRMPAAFEPVRVALGVAGFGRGDRLTLALSAAGGLAIGAAVLLAITAWRARRGRPEGALFGDARAIVPRHPRDYGAAALLAISAGVTEELLFRLLLPLLTAAATGGAVLGFVGATLLFGWAHRYQGWRGVAATTVAGTAMVLGYLVTTSLLLVIAIHAGGDLIHLVARPALRRWVERRRSARLGRHHVET